MVARRLPPRVIATKIAGAHLPQYQQNIAALRPGELLQTMREPDNEHDSNAISLMDANGRDLGYMTASSAEGLAPRMDAGWPVYVLVNGLYGHDDDVGAVLLAITHSPDASSEIADDVHVLAGLIRSEDVSYEADFASSPDGPVLEYSKTGRQASRIPDDGLDVGDSDYSEHAAKFGQFLLWVFLIAALFLCVVWNWIF